MDGGFDAADLSFVPTRLLLEEVARRYDASIFAGVVQVETGQLGNERRWQGNPLLCLGMTQRITYDLMHAANECDDPVDDDEDLGLPESEDDPSWN